MSGRPLPGGCRGLHALKLLKDLAPILEPNLVGMWDTVIPKLTQYLEGGKKYLVLRLQVSVTAVTRKAVCSYLAYIVGSFRFFVSIEKHHLSECTYSKENARAVFK